MPILPRRRARASIPKALAKAKMEELKQQGKVTITAKRIAGVTVTHVRERSGLGEPILRSVELRRGNNRIIYTAVQKRDELTGKVSTRRRLRVGK